MGNSYAAGCGANTAEVVASPGQCGAICGQAEPFRRLSPVFSTGTAIHKTLRRAGSSALAARYRSVRRRPFALSAGFGGLILEVVGFGSAASVRRPLSAPAPGGAGMVDAVKQGLTGSDDPIRDGRAERADAGPFRHKRRNATLSIRWLAPLARIRLARWRVGRMLSRRFGRLIVVQSRSAISRASVSPTSAYFRK